MYSQHLNEPVVRAQADDRARAAVAARAAGARERPRPPGAVRRSAASAALRLARRLDADAAQHVRAA